MAAITKSINGVVATINPAVFQTTGPSGQTIDFTSRAGTGVSSPINITFSEPVAQVGIEIVGISFEGHEVNAYSSEGQRVFSRNVTLSTGRFDLGGGGEVVAVAISPENITSGARNIARVELIPPPADYVGYRNLTLSRITTTTTPPVVTQPPITTTPVFTQPPSPPTPPAPSVRTINLRDFVTLSSYTIDRQYIKGSLRSIPKEVITVTNRSTELDITVSLLGLAGVSFNPSTFELTKNSSREVDVIFDYAAIDTYPEGVSAVTCVMNLSSNSVVVDPLPATAPAPIPTPTQPVLPPPVPQPPVFTPPPQLPPPDLVTGGGTPATQDGIGFVPTTTTRTPVLPPPPPPPPPPIPPVTTVWVSGLEGGLKYGLPPAGWVQDPFGGTWYPPDDPFVLRDFDRAARPTTIVSAIDGSTGTFNPNQTVSSTGVSVDIINPILILPPMDPPPLPPPPPPEPDAFVSSGPTIITDFGLNEPETFAATGGSGGGGGYVSLSDTQFTLSDYGTFRLEDQFLF